MTIVKSDYLRPGVVHASIKKLLPLGLLLELTDGSTGLVRRREISWGDTDHQLWRQEYTVGQRIAVFPLHIQNGRQEFSIRLVENDPWLAVNERYCTGKLVSGCVAGVAAFGVFIELERGVVGLLHKSQLPVWANQPIEDLFWVGDLVKVIITSIDCDERRMSLSIADIRSFRWENKTEDERDRNVSANGANFDTPPTHLSMGSSPKSIDIHSILVIEDDAVQRSALKQWLQSASQQVEAVGSADEALALLQTYSPDIVLTDVGLPGMSGIEATRHICAHHPNVRCIIMTDWSQADTYTAELEELQAHDVAFLIKPLLPTDLLEVLTRTVLSTSPQRTSVRTESATAIESGVLTSKPSRTQRSSSKPNRTSGVNKLRKHLTRLLRTTRASKVVIFEMDTQQRQIHVVDEWGRPQLHEDAIPHLIHSPVRDVAEDKQPIYIEHADEAGLYLSNLSPLLSFAACIGLPLNVDLPLAYCLFLFFPEPTISRKTVYEYADASALALGAELEKTAFLERWAEMQRVNLVGDLVRGLVHEVNHHLSPINFGLDLLHRRCERLHNLLESDIKHAQVEMDNAARTLGQLIQSVDSLTRTARSFGQMTVLDNESIVRVDLVVERAVTLVRNTLDAPVQITFTQPEQIYVTHGKATHIQQVVVNVLLNAVQQIEQLRPQSGGEVYISLAKSTRIGAPYIHITIEDDGPGIHRQLWQRIFELGFSTRTNEGSGLGLFLAQRLLENSGGCISVDKSMILWGTKVAIDIPVHIA
ncbi:MAG: response regulator [Caldilineaceae bacterium]|nr:response regulator [Caldilineaceae bacterium]